MSFREYLAEMLYDTQKAKTLYFDGVVDIYKNPTRKEVMQIMKDADMGGARFGVDRVGDLYAWDEGLLHADMSKRLGKDWVAMFQYTLGHPTLWLSSGNSEADWKKANKLQGGHLVDTFNQIIPSITSIEMQTKPFTVFWSTEEDKPQQYVSPLAAFR